MALTNGTRGDDFIVSQRADGDWIAGNGGNDTLIGYINADRIFGGIGDDYLNGSDGEDLLQGGAGADTLDGGVGNDVIKGAAGNDTIWDADGGIARGGKGHDVVYVGASGDPAGDIVVTEAYGDAGNDLMGAVVTPYAAIRLYGGVGQDLFAVHSDIASGSGVASVEDFRLGDDIELRLTFNGQPVDAFAFYDADHNGVVNGDDAWAANTAGESNACYWLSEDLGTYLATGGIDGGGIFLANVFALHPDDFI